MAIIAAVVDEVWVVGDPAVSVEAEVDQEVQVGTEGVVEWAGAVQEEQVVEVLEAEVDQEVEEV